MIRRITAIIAVCLLVGGGYSAYDRINSGTDSAAYGDGPQEFVSPPPIPEPDAPPAAPLPHVTPSGREFAQEAPDVALSSSDTDFTRSTPCAATGGTDLFLCYDNYYQRLTKTESVASAINDLKERYDSDSFIRSQCHQMAHVIGRAAVGLYGRIAKAYRYGDSFCWSGYYHGVLEQYVTNANRDDVVANLDAMCSEIPGKERYSFDYYNCVHGLGHGLMFMTGDELFESLDLCTNLAGSWERSSCWGGVFMQNIIADEVNHRKTYLNDVDPLYPCNADIMDDAYKPSCYSMQTSHILDVVGYDFKKVFDVCASVEKRYQTICYQSVGRDASGKTVSDIERTKANCLLGSDHNQRLQCAIGAAKDFVSYYHSDVEAKELCISLPEDLRDGCLSAVTSYYVYFQ